MIEKIDITMTPCYYIVEDIMREAREVFSGLMLTEESMYEVEHFFNQRLRNEANLGNFRTKFYTPMNRLAEFEAIAVRRDAIDPTMLRIVPIWKYADQQPFLWEEGEISS